MSFRCASLALVIALLIKCPLAFSQVEHLSVSSQAPDTQARRSLKSKWFHEWSEYKTNDSDAGRDLPQFRYIGNEWIVGHIKKPEHSIVVAFSKNSEVTLEIPQGFWVSHREELSLVVPLLKKQREKHAVLHVDNDQRVYAFTQNKVYGLETAIPRLDLCCRVKHVQDDQGLRSEHKRSYIFSLLKNHRKASTQLNRITFDKNSGRNVADVIDRNSISLLVEDDDVIRSFVFSFSGQGIRNPDAKNLGVLANAVLNSSAKTTEAFTIWGDDAGNGKTAIIPHQTGESRHRSPVLHLEEDRLRRVGWFWSDSGVPSDRTSSLDPNELLTGLIEGESYSIAETRQVGSGTGRHCRLISEGRSIPCERLGQELGQESLLSLMFEPKVVNKPEADKKNDNKSPPEFFEAWAKQSDGAQRWLCFRNQKVPLCVAAPAKNASSGKLFLADDARKAVVFPLDPSYSKSNWDEIELAQENSLLAALSELLAEYRTELIALREQWKNKDGDELSHVTIVNKGNYSWWFWKGDGGTVCSFDEGIGGHVTKLRVLEEGIESHQWMPMQVADDVNTTSLFDQLSIELKNGGRHWSPRHSSAEIWLCIDRTPESEKLIIDEWYWRDESLVKWFVPSYKRSVWEPQSEDWRPNKHAWEKHFSLRKITDGIRHGLTHAGRMIDNVRSIDTDKSTIRVKVASGKKVTDVGVFSLADGHSTWIQVFDDQHLDRALTGRLPPGAWELFCVQDQKQKLLVRRHGESADVIVREGNGTWSEAGELGGLQAPGLELHDGRKLPRRGRWSEGRLSEILSLLFDGESAPKGPEFPLKDWRHQLVNDSWIVRERAANTNQWRLWRPSRAPIEFAEEKLKVSQPAAIRLTYENVVTSKETKLSSERWTEVAKILETESANPAQPMVVLNYGKQCLLSSRSSHYFLTDNKTLKLTIDGSRNFPMRSKLLWGETQLDHPQADPMCWEDHERQFVSFHGETNRDGCDYLLIVNDMLETTKKPGSRIRATWIPKEFQSAGDIDSNRLRAVAIVDHVGNQKDNGTRFALINARDSLFLVGDGVESGDISVSDSLFHYNQHLPLFKNLGEIPGSLVPVPTSPFSLPTVVSGGADGDLNSVLSVLGKAAQKKPNMKVLRTHLYQDGFLAGSSDQSILYSARYQKKRIYPGNQNDDHIFELPPLAEFAERSSVYLKNLAITSDFDKEFADNTKEFFVPSDLKSPFDKFIELLVSDDESIPNRVFLFLTKIRCLPSGAN